MVIIIIIDQINGMIIVVKKYYSFGKLIFKPSYRSLSFLHYNTIAQICVTLVTHGHSYMIVACLTFLIVNSLKAVIKLTMKCENQG